MAVTLTADLDLLGFKSIVGAYARAGEDLSPLMDQCGVLIEASTKDRLRETNTAPDGTPWPQSLRAKEDGGKTLVDTSRLVNSIQYIAGSAQVEVGTNAIYGGVHQTGREIRPVNGKALSFALPGGGWAVVGKVTIPARPYLGISDDDRSDLTDAATRYFEEAPQ